MAKRISRRDFLALGAGGVAMHLTRSGGGPVFQGEGSMEPTVYLGTYTKGESEGIYICRLDPATGGLRVVGTAAAENPSFLALDPTGRFLYAVNELTEYQGAPSGAVTAFAVRAGNGQLTELGQRPSRGGAPCYLSVDPSGRWVLVANYVGGNAAVLAARPDGALDSGRQVVQHAGSGPVRDRQDGPHAHSVVLDSGGRFAYVADLGIDRVMIYRFDPREGTLESAPEPWVQLAPGSGPRHLVLSAHGRHAYVTNELNSSVAVLERDPERGSLREVQTVAMLPRSFTGRSTAADLHLSRDGRFLYASNRGHDSIVQFTVDPRSGRLSDPAWTPTGGKTPRNFGIDPSGQFLLVANQNSDRVVSFRIDAATGRLQETGATLEVPSPVCVRFARR